MKKLALVSVLAAAVGFSGLAFSGSANAAIDPATERHLVKICKALQSNSRIRLHQAVKQSRLGFRNVAKGLKCNGQDPLVFAMNSGASKNAGYLARKANVDMTTMMAQQEYEN